MPKKQIDPQKVVFNEHGIPNRCEWCGRRVQVFWVSNGKFLCCDCEDDYCSRCAVVHTQTEWNTLHKNDPMFWD